MWRAEGQSPKGVLYAADTNHLCLVYLYYLYHCARHVSHYNDRYTYAGSYIYYPCRKSIEHENCNISCNSTVTEKP